MGVSLIIAEWSLVGIPYFIPQLLDHAIVHSLIVQPQKIIIVPYRRIPAIAQPQNIKSVIRPRWIIVPLPGPGRPVTCAGEIMPHCLMAGRHLDVIEKYSVGVRVHPSDKTRMGRRTLGSCAVRSIVHHSVFNQSVYMGGLNHRMTRGTKVVRAPGVGHYKDEIGSLLYHHLLPLTLGFEVEGQGETEK